jgi:hypothetical protein
MVFVWGKRRRKMTWNEALSEYHHHLICANSYLKKAKLAIEQGNKFKGYCLIGEAQEHIDGMTLEVVREGEK